MLSFARDSILDGQKEFLPVPRSRPRWNEDNNRNVITNHDRRACSKCPAKRRCTLRSRVLRIDYVSLCEQRGMSGSSRRLYTHTHIHIYIYYIYIYIYNIYNIYIYFFRMDRKCRCNHGWEGWWWQLKQVIEIKQTTYLNQTQISLILK